MRCLVGINVHCIFDDVTLTKGQGQTVWVQRSGFYYHHCEHFFQEHMNQYCWTHTLYYYPNASDPNVMPYEIDNATGLAADPDIRDNGSDSPKIEYFRYVTVLFILQAIMFKVRCSY